MKNKRYTVKELPVSERPYEKCENFGPCSLSDAELLAVIIRTGSKEERAVDLAHRIMNFSEEAEGLVSLNYMTMESLMTIKGIGRVKAVQLLCVAELTKRMAKNQRRKGIKLSSPDKVANYYMQDMRHLTREEMILVMMDSKSKLLKDMVISSGTVNASIVSPREIFLDALKYSAVHIILLHNHPSGDPTPSKDDISITQKVKEAGMLIGIKLMDHIIIGDNRYISLKETGVL